MKNFRQRFQFWVNEIQQRLGVATMSLQAAKEAMASAREVFRLSTHKFTEEQMPVVEEIERALDSSNWAVLLLLKEIEALRSQLDRLPHDEDD